MQTDENMNLDNIKSALARLQSLVGDCEERGISDMERDLMLRELRDLYTVVRFTGTTPVAYPVLEPEDESEAEAERQPAPAAEPAAEAVAEQPEAEAEPEPEPEVESEAAASEIAAEPAETADEAPAADEKAEQQFAAEMQTLFAPEELAVSKRRRMIVRSLYGEDASDDETSAVSDDKSETTVKYSAPAETTDLPAFVGEEDSEEDAFSILSEIDIPRASSGSDESAVAGKEESEVETVVEAIETVSVAESVREAVPETLHAPAEHVLGDTINPGVQTIGDTIRLTENAVAEAVGNSHIASLKEAIGINDRFLLIRDLFDGNAAEYERAIERLDSFEDENACLIHIVENYSWNPYSEGAKLLMGLIERRYGSRA